MHKRLVSAVAAAMLLAPVIASASMISGSWDFSGVLGGQTYNGTFSFTDLDTTQNYTNSDAAGFSVSTDFVTNGAGSGFDFESSNQVLTVGSLDSNACVGCAFINTNTWWLLLSGFPSATTGPMAYGLIGSPTGVLDGTVTVAPVGQVPVPPALGLFGSGLAIMALALRNRAPLRVRG